MRLCIENECLLLHHTPGARGVEFYRVKHIAIGRVSVVIPTYNRSAYLRRVIGSYFQQPAVHQVVVVDDGSLEDYAASIRYARELAVQCGAEVVYLRHPRRQGAPTARNTALEHVTGEAVLFTDDDVLIAPDFIEIALERLEALPADIVGGRMILASEFSEVNTDLRASPEGRVQAKVFNYLALTADYTADTGQDVELPFVHTVSVWRRWVLDHGVRFDSSYGGNGYREESAAQLLARRLGARICHCPRMVFWHVRSIRTGGQHRGSKLWWYLWSLRNNWRFLRNHYAFLQHTFHLRAPWWVSFVALAVRLTSIFVPHSFKNWVKRLAR